MVTIITGEVDSGKTTALLRRFSVRPAGKAGFVCKKIYEGTALTGYELCSLATPERRIIAVLRGDKLITEDTFSFGPFLFFREGFRLGEEIIERAVKDGGVTELLIDEIGPLELEGRGFSRIFEVALNSGKDVTVCIRSGCLMEAARRFGIKDPMITPAGT